MPNHRNTASGRQALPDYGLALDSFLCFAIYGANHAFNRVYKPHLDKVGLTYPQFLTMVALWERDDCTVSDLGERLSLESSTMTPLLKRLEAMGHVTRSRDPANERNVRVCLTPKGNALRTAAQRIPSCIVDAAGLDLGLVSELLANIAETRTGLERALRDMHEVASAGPKP